ncbi:MAG: oligosaccharide flippase family protein [Flavobacteriaceae bacterium]|nr:oligosaccharide flippase family protein [Flavobacteriaceae bacterium]
MPFDIKSIFSKNFINLTLNQCVNIIATLFYTPILFQILGEENFGLIQLAFSVVIILSIFVSYGYNLNGPIKIVQSQDAKKENLIISEILNLRLTLSVLVFVISIPFLYLQSNIIYQKILIFSYIILLAEALNPLFYLQGINKILPQSILNFFSKSIYVILIILFIRDAEDAYLANFFYGISISFLFLIFWMKLFLSSSTFNYRFSLKKIIINLKENLHLFLSSTSTHFTVNGALIILNLFVSNQELGRFSLAYKVAFILRMIPVFFIQSILQHATEIKDKSKEKFHKFLSNYYKFGLLTTLIIAIITCFFSDFIIEIFADEKIDYSSKILSLLSFIPFLAMLNFKNVVYMLVNDLKSKLNKATFYTLLLFLINSLILTNLYGGYGLAYSLLLTEIFSFLIHYFLINRK